MNKYPQWVKKFPKLTIAEKISKAVQRLEEIKKCLLCTQDPSVDRTLITEALARSIHIYCNAVAFVGDNITIVLSNLDLHVLRQKREALIRTELFPELDSLVSFAKEHILPWEGGLKLCMDLTQSNPSYIQSSWYSPQHPKPVRQDDHNVRAIKENIRLFGDRIYQLQEHLGKGVSSSYVIHALARNIHLFARVAKKIPRLPNADRHMDVEKYFQYEFLYNIGRFFSISMEELPLHQVLELLSTGLLQPKPHLELIDRIEKNFSFPRSDFTF